MASRLQIPIALGSVLLLAGVVHAQARQSPSASGAARTGKVDVISVHGWSLEGNLAGDSADNLILAKWAATHRSR